MKKYTCLLILSCLLQQSCSNKLSSNRTPSAQATEQKEARRGEVLFLGNTSKHHDSGKYAPWLAISLFKKGVNLTYTVDLNDLNTANLSKYDGLIIYANHDSISVEQEKALKDFVESGKGIIPLHSASGCFKNSEWYVKTVGGQFKSHGTGPFATTIVNKKHPVMQGLAEFTTSWDETYVHQKLNPDMTVLMTRPEGSASEPYTWVRNQGKGRVFYTAYGHNDSTWTNPGFQKLVNNGVLWALGDGVAQQIARLAIPDVDIYSSSNINITDYTKRHLVPKMQAALTPDESKKLIQVPADFDIQLFAAEPDITNPIAMAWDEKGRLWIVESVDYPNTFLETDGAANDRIKICEDTNGDGRADKFTVFADKLNIPTSMVFANGGIIVSMAPHFVFLKDTNGDDKADVRENIMTGWDKNDTHFGPSNLQYGFNNKIWGVVGSGFNGTTRDGKTLNFRTGVYNLNPDGTGVDFLANTSNNTWGLGFSEDNNVFISTANNTHSAFYSMPAKYMQRALPGATLQAVQKIDGHYDAHTLTPNLRQVDVVGGFTSAAGHHLYTARSFPQSYWNRIAFICEPTVRLVHSAIIEPSGAGFTEKDGWNFLASSDEWVGPVQAEVGPDGALWVADWYNFIIQHNVFVERQAPSNMVLPFTEQLKGQGNAFISPLRDINFGRVYRVVYKKAKPYTPIKLTITDTPALLAALKSDNMFWRMTAQRLLVEAKNQAVVPELLKIIADQRVDAIGLNSPAVHALWTLHGLGVLNGNSSAVEAVTKALNHPAAGVRKAAIEVMPGNNQTGEIFQKTNAINDPNLNVRLAAMVATVTLPASEAAGAALWQATLNPENEKDEWIARALFAAATAHRDGFLAAAAQAAAT
ncbi:MAG: ThuA domain-containing protein, partial [Cytophagaceae bacterium]|nr:ThuA domain-containing protein [Cytophagaceae bacterium]